MNTINPFKTTMSGRQHGKSIFGKTANVAWVDEAAELFDGLEEPVKYLEFNTPPLALICAMIDAGKDLPAIVNYLQGVGKRSYIGTKPIISKKHQAQADDIYNYFSKKHTLRRIKGEWISKFMLAVDELCENRKRINEEHLKVLVSLPRIYEQNRAVERVMKGHKSAPQPNALTYPPMEGVVEFVEKVPYKIGKNNELHYYFSTPNNYLMRVVVKKGEYGEVAWDTLSQAGKLHIDSETTWTYNIKGYDFSVMQFSPQSTKITII